MNGIAPYGEFTLSEWKVIGGAVAEGFGKGLAAGIDGMIPLIDPFADVYADDCGNVDGMYATSRFLGGVSRDAFLAATGLRVGAWAGGAKAGRVLNHNRYVRIGPNNIPREKPLTYGPGQKVPTLRIENGKSTWYNHLDLRIHGK